MDGSLAFNPVFLLLDCEKYNYTLISFQSFLLAFLNVSDICYFMAFNNNKKLAHSMIARSTIKLAGSQ